jgi:integrase
VAAIEKLPASYKKLKPGFYGDGGNLYLQKWQEPGSWIFRYRLRGGKSRDMGLGSLNDVSLAEARETAREYRKLVKQGIDPIARRESAVAHNLAVRTAGLTFDQAAEAYIRQHSDSWKNPSHAAQWPATLKAYASPVIGKMSVADIDTPQIIRVLEPIWREKTETAKRLRGRIEQVLGWATVGGHRKGDNPARWRGHLATQFAPPSKVSPVKHQTALPYIQIPAFMAELRQREGIGALALEFTILTCVRTADVRNAKHADVDRLSKTWAIASFSKTGARHVVPLSEAALAAFDKVRGIIAQIGRDVARSEYAFPNDVTGAPLSENAMLAVLNRMGRKGVATTHGFRSSFRSWAQEQTNFPWELAEMSLGHRVGSKVERAYARGDALEKRFSIMEAWARYCIPDYPSDDDGT